MYDVVTTTPTLNGTIHNLVLLNNNTTYNGKICFEDTDSTPKILCGTFSYKGGVQDFTYTMQNSLNRTIYGKATYVKETNTLLGDFLIWKYGESFPTDNTTFNGTWTFKSTDLANSIWSGEYKLIQTWYNYVIE